MQKERINSINALKGISCCVIAFLWHYLNMQPRDLGMPFENIFRPFYLHGQYFVELFFMLSGFGMAYGYRDKIAAGEDFYPYIVRRYKHLYPLFFTTLLATTVLQILYHQITDAFYVYQCSVWHFILNLLCIQTGILSYDQSFNGPAWCISVEIVLYVLFYATTYSTRKNKNAYTLVSLLCFLAATIYIYLEPPNFPIFNMYTMRGVSCFYAGVLICELNDRLGGRKRSFASGSLVLLVMFRICLHFSPWSFWANENQGRLCLILFQWPILLFAVINCGYLRKLLEIKPLLYLGKISMDVFLWHIPVQIVIKTADRLLGLKINYGSWMVWLLYISMVFGVAAVSGKFRKEQPDYFRSSAVALACCVLAVAATDWTGISFRTVFGGDMSYANRSSVITMEPGARLEETFSVEEKSYIKKIEFYSITWNKHFSDDQHLSIDILDAENGESVCRYEIPLASLPDGRAYSVEVKEDVLLESGRSYTIAFSSSTEKSEQTMALMCTNVSEGGEGASINGRETEQHISCRISGVGKAL